MADDLEFGAKSRNRAWDGSSQDGFGNEVAIPTRFPTITMYSLIAGPRYRRAGTLIDC